jgi:hypothetical protein
MRRISRLIVAGCLVASLLGACSSSGSTGKVTGNKVLSKSDYIAQADAICRSYSGKIDSVVSGAGSGLTLEQQKQIFRDKLIPLFRGQLVALSDLRPPKADQARIDDFRLNMSQAINTIVAGVDAAKSVADLRNIKPSGLAKFKKQAEAYGMKYC